jgi:chromosome segregation ATPase
VQADLEQARAELKDARTSLQAARQEAQAKGVEAAKATQAREHTAGALQAQLAEAKRGAAALTVERDHLRKELSALRIEHETAVRRLNGGEGQGARLAAAQKALGQARAEVHDLQVRLKKFETDRTALANLSRQQEARIRVLNDRIEDVLRSRWRKYGQRLLPMIVQTPAWERDMRNGKV